MTVTTATFAAGCFWGVEARFREVPGVIDAVVGYTGGIVDHPTYKQVCTGTTGHAEAVELTFNDAVVSYEQLVDVFFSIHNPTTLNRQGPDRGTQYRSAIFFHDEEQRATAEEFIESLEGTGRWSGPVVTELKPAATFWRAEEYHQRYLEKNNAAVCHV
jgi:peptide-methionine (S)-S-oxide reductase